MSVTDENDLVLQKHHELCLELNMDSVSRDKSWVSYDEIRNIYTLDGDQKHWLCCALYVACRKSITPTVGNASNVVEGNCVSLTKLLSVCNISLNDFFKKMKSWCGMASVPPEFRARVDRLERSFAVSKLLYQKFSPIFRDLFICPPSDEFRVGKGKKVKSTPCTANKVFELCWCLFICGKGEYPQQGVELVTSFNILLCCADLIFANAIVSNRRDLVNTSFPGVPESWKLGELTDTPVCIMKELCERHEGTIVDATEIKHYSWKTTMKSFFDKKILKGDPDTFMNLLSMGNFESNLKSLNKLYETYTLSCGEFDERIFLNHTDVGSSRLGGSVKKTEVKSDLERQAQYDDNMTALVKGTPLTRRNDLPPRNDFLTPVTSATMSVNKLRTMLAEHKDKPKFTMCDLFASCTQNPQLKIEKMLKEMSKKFCDNFQTNGAERFRLAEALYYRLLENIIRGEMKQKPLDCNIFLNHDSIHQSLIVCSVEIVLGAYNYERKFPWILEVFHLDAFTFHKLIELVVRYHQDLLTRDMVKHLNRIEEQCLESLIWTSSSPIWAKIKQMGGDLLSHKDVARKNDDELSGITKFDNNHFLMSPTPSDSNQFFESPVKSMAKMQLFKTIKDDPQTSESNTMDTTTATATESRSTNTTDSTTTNRTPVINGGGGAANGSGNNRANTNPPPNIGSLKLVLRKFYELAYPRMYNLCCELGLRDEDLLKKIWTIFEHSIAKETELMRDRHLDQILMCAIYVFNRVTKLDKTFTDIMKFYRTQPQAESHVYRSVLISRRCNRKRDSENPSETSAPIPQGPARPGDLAGRSTSHGNEERGDIIKFYNTVYVVKMQAFSLKFANSDLANDIPLSPLPQGRSNLMSPKKISGHHKIYVTPMEKKEPVPESPSSMTYSFYKSPAKDLHKINSIVANGTQVALTPLMSRSAIKRNLPFDDTTPMIMPAAKVIKSEMGRFRSIDRRLTNIITERQDNRDDETRK